MAPGKGAILCDASSNDWSAFVAYQKLWAQPAHLPPSGLPLLAPGKGAISSMPGAATAALSAPQPRKPGQDDGVATGPTLVVRNTFLEFDDGVCEPCELSRSRSCDAVMDSHTGTSECQVISGVPFPPEQKCSVRELEMPCVSRKCQAGLAAVKPEPSVMGWPEAACVGICESDDCPPSPVHWPERACPPQNPAPAGLVARVASFLPAAAWAGMPEGSVSENAASCVPQCTAFPVPGVLVAYPAPVACWAPHPSGGVAGVSESPLPHAPDAREQTACPEDTPLGGTRCRKRARRQRKTANAVTAAAVARQANDSVVSHGLCFSEMMTQLDASGEQQRCAMAALRGHFARAAFDPQGCRVAQVALDVAGGEELVQLTSELRGTVRKALESPHANFVVQKMVQVMPPAQVQFVVEELRGVAVQTALHCFGCRVICRLLEHCPHRQTEHLVDEVLREGAVLCKDTFGNHVVRHILEHGAPEQRRVVARVLLKDLLHLASHRCASCVVEKALSHCAAEESGDLARALMHDGDTLAQLGCSRYGSYVVRALLDHAQVDAAEARSLLRSVSPRLRQCRFGERLLEDLRGERVV